jgi:hypothetical protein
VYISMHRHLRSANVMQGISELRDTSKGKDPHPFKFTSTDQTNQDATFELLHKTLTRKWILRDDTVSPFGDWRGNLTAVYWFDLD